MKTAVEFHSGPFITALTSCPSQSSPLVMENPLCSLSPSRPGVTTENAGSLPVLASVMNWASLVLPSPAALSPLHWPVYSNSANVGQIAHPYVSDCGVLVHSFRPLGVVISVVHRAPYSRQGRPAALSRSMMTGTYGTGVCANAPPFGRGPPW